MTYEQLQHAIRAACNVANEEEVIVFGSQAVLGKYPDASEHLRQSMEADIAPASRCVEAHDLAASKLAAFREKDRDFVRTLVSEGLVNARKLRQRITELPHSNVPVEDLLRWFEATVEEIVRPVPRGRG